MTTVVNNFWVDANGRIFERADAFNSLNVVSTQHINFSLQADRTTDPTTETIALQLDDTNGITIDKPVVNNQTFQSIGNTMAEATENAWGDLNSQHSPGMREVLKGSDNDFETRNGDTDRQLRFIVGAIGSTPQLEIDNDSVNLFGHFDIIKMIVQVGKW